MTSCVQIAVLASIAVLAGCFQFQLHYCENGAIYYRNVGLYRHEETECGDPANVVVCKAEPDPDAV